MDPEVVELLTNRFAESTRKRVVAWFSFPVVIIMTVLTFFGYRSYTDFEEARKKFEHESKRIDELILKREAELQRVSDARRELEELLERYQRAYTNSLIGVGESVQRQVQKTDDAAKRAIQVTDETLTQMESEREASMGTRTLLESTQRETIETRARLESEWEAQREKVEASRLETTSRIQDAEARLDALSGCRLVVIDGDSETRLGDWNLQISAGIWREEVSLRIQRAKTKLFDHETKLGDSVQFSDVDYEYTLTVLYSSVVPSGRFTGDLAELAGPLSSAGLGLCRRPKDPPAGQGVRRPSQ